MREERLYEEFARLVMSTLHRYGGGTDVCKVNYAMSELLNDKHPKYHMINQKIMQSYVDNPDELRVDIHVLRSG